MMLEQPPATIASARRAGPTRHARPLAVRLQVVDGMIGQIVLHDVGPNLARHPVGQWVAAPEAALGIAMQRTAHLEMLAACLGILFDAPASKCPTKPLACRPSTAGGPSLRLRMMCSLAWV